MPDSTGPTAIVLAGPNGAGKTTSARTFLAETLKVMTFVNADLIAQGLSGFDQESSAFEAGRLMLQRLTALAKQKASFAFETTLAGRLYERRFRSLRKAGYRIHLVYFWLANADLAVRRVAQRVRSGGYGIPESTIRLRYQRSLTNFFRVYRPIVTSWNFYDNSKRLAPRFIAGTDETGQISIIDTITWDQIKRGHE